MGHSRARRGPALVRYCSPFGTPAWMPRAEAERYQSDDDRRWLKYAAAGALSEYQRRHGPPFIEGGA